MINSLENNHDKGTLSNKYEDTKCVESDENTSSLGRSFGPSMVNDSDKRNADDTMHNSAFSYEVPSSNDPGGAHAGNSSPKEKSNKVSTVKSGSLHTKYAASLVLSDEHVKHTFQEEQDDKSKNLIEPNECKHSSRSPTENESDESDIVEHDVKVCDICGDAGHEAELAVCSRCSDGAEHIYCMRHMLKKLPDGNWLCEECRAWETENQRQEAKGKLVSNVNSTPQISGKRILDNIDIGPEPKRQVLKSDSGPSTTSSAKQLGQLLCESSFKSVGRGRIKPGHQMSSCDHSGSDFIGRVRSPTTVHHGPGPKGSLPKSNSFSTLNSKQKVKLVDEIHAKQKRAREHTIKEFKEGPGRLLSKSMSSKSMNPSGSNATESKAKMLSPKVTHAQDKKGLLQEKDWCASDMDKVDCPLGRTSSKVLTPIIGQKLVARIESNNKEFGLVHDKKLHMLPKHSSILPRKTDSSEKTSSCVDGNQHNGLLQPQELTNLDDEIRDISGICFVQAAAPKCKEVGHAAEVCSSDHALEISFDVAAVTRSEDNVHKENRLKAAIHAALLRRPEICKKKVVDRQSDDLSTSNSDFNCEVPSQDQTVFLNKSKNNMYAEVHLEGRGIADNSTTKSFESTAGRNGKQLSVCSLDSFVTKPLVRGLLNKSSADAPIIMETLAIPECKFIWQGLFEVLRIEKPPELFGGMQGHLSTSASPKVLDVVDKFPQRVHLSEMPRLSVWPSQFHQSGAREDNIALYFFAKDIDSYEKHYKILLDRMMKNDLVLKGNFDGIELLIFPSNQLPGKSQCWNTFFYLWGVFKGNRTYNSVCLQKALIPTSTLTCSDTDLCPAVKTLSQPHCSQKQENSVATENNTAQLK